MIDIHFGLMLLKLASCVYGAPNNSLLNLSRDSRIEPKISFLKSSRLIASSSLRRTLSTNTPARAPPITPPTIVPAPGITEPIAAPIAAPPAVPAALDIATFESAFPAALKIPLLTIFATIAAPIPAAAAPPTTLLRIETTSKCVGKTSIRSDAMPGIVADPNSGTCMRLFAMIVLTAC